MKVKTVPIIALFLIITLPVVQSNLVKAPTTKELKSILAGKKSNRNSKKVSESEIVQQESH